MKKKLKRAAALGLALTMAILVLAGCGGVREETTVTETVSGTFDFDGNQVEVTVDVSDGWTAEFGQMATYLYDGPNDGQREAVASGTFAEKEEYDAILAEEESGEYSEDYLDFTQLDNGVAFTDSIGVQHYVFAVEGDMYYRIAVQPAEGVDAQAVFDRFTVKLIEAAT